MKLCLVHPAVGEFAFPVRPSATSMIGRKGLDVDIELAWDPRVSRLHARLWCEGDRVWIEDVGSRNGIWVGQERIAGAYCLEPGRMVILGETALFLPERDPTGDHGTLEETFDSGREMLALAPTMPPLALDLLPPVEAQARPVSGTVDLVRTSSGPRAAARLIDPQHLEVDVVERAVLQHLWNRDLAHGGLFVELEAALPPGARLEVRLLTAFGPIHLNGQVVHVITGALAAQSGIPAGIGIELLDLGPPKRAMLLAALDGVAAAPAPEPATPSNGVPPSAEQVLATARRILAEAEREDFYSALELTPTSTDKEIEARLDLVKRSFTQAIPNLPPPQAARLEAAQNVTERMRRVLGNEEGRLEYDFRQGYVRAEQRLAAAAERSGPPLATLRRVWLRVWPERVEEAASLTRRAFAARQVKDFGTAVDAGRQALALNPFFDELRKTLDTWIQMTGGERVSDTTLPPRHRGARSASTISPPTSGLGTLKPRP
jgi:hypothetical protein